MIVSNVRKLPPVERLLYWIREREAIRLRKEAGEPWPWTDDEILRTYRFCNVRRMDDKVSRWLLENWYRPHRNHPNLLLACTVARQLNNPDSLAAVGFPTRWDPKRMDRILHGRAAEGKKNFSAAYMITGTLGGTKIHQIVWKVADELFRDPPSVDTDSLRVTAERLLPYNGFSHFIAGQVVADLRWAMNGRWADRHSWAPIGPGSRRGMNILLGYKLDQLMSAGTFLTHFRELLSLLRRRLPRAITERMEAHDYQNCLCESFKYHKALFGIGRPKQLYRRNGNQETIE